MTCDVNMLPCARYPLDTKCESETHDLKKKLANVEREKEELQMKVSKWEQVELRETYLMRWLQDDDMTPSVTSGYVSARASSVCSEDINETKRDTFDSAAQDMIDFQKDRSSLILACKRGNRSVIKKILQNGETDFESPDENGMTPLMLAVGGGHFESVKFLTDHISTINRKTKRGKTALMIAVYSGYLNIVKLLVKIGADLSVKDDNKNTVLNIACLNDNVPIVKYLLTKTPDIEVRGAFGKTPLMTAAEMGCRKVFDLLLSEGADITVKDDYKNTVLHVACFKDNVEFVKYLLTKTPDIEVRGAFGRTPLMTAAEMGCRKVFDLLLRKGADITVRDDYNDTVLNVACLNDNVEFVNYLLTKTPDIEVRGAYGRTPLMTAARCGCSKVFDLLINHRANPSLTDEQNKNIHHHASVGRSANIIQHVVSLMDDG